MKTVEQIETNTDKTKLYYWNEKEETVEEINPNDEKYQKLLAVNKALLTTLEMLVNDIKDLVGDDLREVWKRLDRLEDVQ